MKAMKDLVLKAKEVAVELSNEEFNKTIEHAEEFLTASKSFEYFGQLKVPHGVSLKLVDLSSDLDDVVKVLAGKNAPFEMKVYMCIVVMPEAPAETPAATVPALPAPAAAAMCGE